MGLTLHRKEGEFFTLDFGGVKAVITVQTAKNRGAWLRIDAPREVAVTRPDMKIKEEQHERRQK